MPDVYVTNYNKNFTGVSATIDGVAHEQAKSLDLRLVGVPLPNFPEPITKSEARKLSRTPPAGRDFSIWHVRRDPEMISAIWARDVLRLPIKTVFTSAARHQHGKFPSWLISKMDAIIATSPDAASFFPSVAATAPHGVDTESYAPCVERAAAWQALGYGGAKGVAIIGRVRPAKGTDVFVDAMIKLMQDDPDLVGLILGQTKKDDQAFLDEMQAKIAAHGLSERIIFTGFVEHEKQRRIMQAISLVVNVARYEPFGVVPLEGMSSGTPFVASDTGFYRELSEGGKHGVIVETGSADQAAEAVGALLANPNKIEEMGTRGRAYVVAQHSIAREARQIGEVYAQLWENNGRIG